MRVDVLPLCHATYLYDRDDVDSTRGVSIVLHFKQDTMTRPDGETDRMPSLKGISGCGIWRLYGADDRLGRLDTFRESFPSLPRSASTGSGRVLTYSLHSPASCALR
jgi:hypothetical protein